MTESFERNVLFFCFHSLLLGVGWAGVGLAGVGAGSGTGTGLGWAVGAGAGLEAWAGLVFCFFLASIGWGSEIGLELGCDFFPHV